MSIKKPQNDEVTATPFDMPSSKFCGSKKFAKLPYGNASGSGKSLWDMASP